MESTNYMTFYENWVDIMEMCTAEEWYQLSKMITNLRFKKIDTDVKTISNIKIKMAWVAIRPSILKSNRNTRHNNKKKQSQGVENNPTDIAPNTEFEESQITEENNMGNYIGYIQNMTTQVSGTQNTTEAQKPAYNVAFSQNDTNIPTEVKSVSNRPKMALNEIFEDAFLVDELKRWKNELMADNTHNFQMNAKVKVEQIANRYNYTTDDVWEELIGYIIDTDFENNVGDIPDWCWAEFKNCFLTTEEVSNGDYDKKLITVMKNKDEINRCYKILLNKYEGEKLATIKRFVNVAYKDMKFSYEN